MDESKLDNDIEYAASWLWHAWQVTEEPSRNGSITRRDALKVAIERAEKGLEALKGILTSLEPDASKPTNED